MSIDILLNERTVFTDASANTKDPPHFYEDPADLDRLDWTAINGKKWSMPDSERHRRMAELLIHGCVEIKDIEHIVVWNTSVEKFVLDIFEKNNVAPPTIGYGSFKNRYFYFTKFQSGDNTESLVTGPHFFKQTFESTIAQITHNRAETAGKTRFPHADIKGLLDAIRENFQTLFEMADIFKLEVFQGNSTHIVSDQTEDVVRNIEKDSFYQSCNMNDKQILLLAAYLYGIGKAPSFSARGETHKVFSDYPKNSLEKLVRLLTEEIGQLSDYEIRKLCLLVGYHDLVSDIVLRHRDENQLFDLIADETELDMLIAIAFAGIGNIGFGEKKRIKNEMQTLRQKAIDRL